MLLAYVYVNGLHNGAIEIKNSAKSVAAAIMHYGQFGNLMITDTLDRPVVSSNGFFLNQWFGNGVKFSMNELQNELIPMQFKVKDYSEKDFLYVRKK